MSTSREELKPCPFCGRRPTGIVVSPEFAPVCDVICGCGGSMNACNDEEFAIEAWNTRATTPKAGVDEIAFGYTNWRGKTSQRRAIPISVRYGSSDYHKEDQWLMLALDLDKDEEREFAMRDMLLIDPPNVILAVAPDNAGLVSGGGR